MQNDKPKNTQSFNDIPRSRRSNSNLPSRRYRVNKNNDYGSNNLNKSSHKAHNLSIDNPQIHKSQRNHQSLSPHKNIGNRTLDTINPSRRPMPINDRENVFNEWAAVIKHQDEIDREVIMNYFQK